MSKIKEEMLEWIRRKKIDLDEQMHELHTLEFKLNQELPPPRTVTQESSRYSPYPEDVIRFEMSHTMLAVWKVLKKFGTLQLHPLTTRAIVQYAQQEGWLEKANKENPNWEFKRHRNRVRVALKTFRENPHKYPSIRWKNYSNHKKHGVEYFYHVAKPGDN